MKTVLFFILFVVPALYITGQNNNFKAKLKNPPGTTDPGFNFKKSNAIKGSGSATLNKFTFSQPLPLQRSGGDEKGIKKVIRKDGVPIFIEKTARSGKSAGKISWEERFYSFLKETSEISGIIGTEELFKITQIVTDNLGITHIRAIRQYKGIDIYGSESTLHIEEGKERFTGSFYSVSKDVQTVPKISYADAIQTTITDIKQITIYKDLNSREKEILQYDSPSCTLVLYNFANHKHVLAWAVIIRPNFIEEWKYFINAVTGNIIHKFNNTFSEDRLLQRDMT